MSAERKILVWWLNRKGFFTIHNVNAGEHRVIDVIALKNKESDPEIAHYEVSCSISQSDGAKMSDYNQKFFDKKVNATVKKVIVESFGKEIDYKKVIVVNSSTKLKENNDLGEIEVLYFEDVLYDLFDNLDTQNYGDDIIRTVQLIKWLFLVEPKKLAGILGKKDDLKVLSVGSREQLINALISKGDFQKVLAKPQYEEVLASIVKESKLSTPEVLSKHIVDGMIAKRNRLKFLHGLLKDKDMRAHLENILTKKEIKEMIARKEKPLQDFYEQKE